MNRFAAAAVPAPLYVIAPIEREVLVPEVILLPWFKPVVMLLLALILLTCRIIAELFSLGG